MNVEIWETDEWRTRVGLFLGQYLMDTDGRARLFTSDEDIKWGIRVLLAEGVFDDAADLRCEALLDFGVLIPHEYCEVFGNVK